MALSKDQMQAGLSAALEQIEATQADHERAVHGGGICERGRLSIIAWIAHRLGLKSDAVAMALLSDAIRGYEADCPNCQHGTE